MSQQWLAFVSIAVLISVVQSAWVRVAGRIDPALLPVAARHRVHWLLANSARIQLTLAVLGLGALGAGLTTG